MPEMPEVETIRQDLKARILHKPITRVDIRKPKLVRSDLKSLTTTLLSNSFTDIDRRGKLMIFHLETPSLFLLWHLKMTGQLIYQEQHQIVAGGHPFPPVGEALPNKYSHIILGFNDDSALYFNDLRQFGYIELIDAATLAQKKAQYGPEPLSPEFSLDYFKQVVANRPGSTVKSVLLDQKAVAGLGNIYADECCFVAGVRPDRSVRTLTKQQTKALYDAVRQVLPRAIALRGTTFRDYRDAQGGKGNFTDQLQVYGRPDQPCLRCGVGRIRKVKAAGRGTHYCDSCQK